MMLGSSTPAPVSYNHEGEPSKDKRSAPRQPVTFSVQSLSRARLFETPWTVAHQAHLSMEFSRQEYWCGVPYPSPGALPDPGIGARSPELQADALPSEPPEKPHILDTYMLMSEIFPSVIDLFIIIYCPSLSLSTLL